MPNYDAEFKNTLEKTLSVEGEYFLKSIILVYIVRKQFYDLGESLSASLI